MIISLLPAVALGFICGIIVSPLQLESGPTLAVGVIGAVVVLAIGLSSVLGVRGHGGEKALVGFLRAACAVGVFVCIYLFMLSFLRDGNPGGLLWLLPALGLGLVMSRLTVRRREEVGEASS